MKANNKADQIGRQVHGQGKISLFTGEKKRNKQNNLREALKLMQKY